MIHRTAAVIAPQNLKIFPDKQEIFSSWTEIVLLSLYVWTDKISLVSVLTKTFLIGTEQRLETQLTFPVFYFIGRDKKLPASKLPAAYLATAATKSPFT